MLNNTKIGPKLIGGFVAVALVSVTVGLVGRHFLIVNDVADTFLYEKMTIPLQELAKANAAFLKNRLMIRDIIRTNDPAKIAERDAAITRNTQIVSDAMAEFEKRIITDAGRAAFAEFTKDRAAFLENLTAMRKLAAENRDEEAYAMMDGDGARMAESEQEAIDKLMELKMESAKKTSDDNTVRTEKAINTMWAVIILGFLGAMGLGLFLTNSIVGPLQRGLAMMTDLALGHLQMRLRLDRQDEIGRLANAMDRFADDLQNNVVGSMSQISAGDLTVQVNPKDERDEIAPAINKTAASLRGLVEESKKLTDAALEGRLSTRGDASKFQGGYREIVQGVNDTLDAVIKPVQDAASVLERIAHKDMTARVKGEYQGDHAKIKEAVNLAAETLDQSLQQVAVGADQIASASGQIGTGAQSLAQGTSEQASSLEEVSSSLQEMTAMTRQNSANAKEARGIAEATKTSAENGVASMQRLSAAMDLIKKSSDDTAKIIKTIDEIAFQTNLLTNLLALNAAVEAARAGEAGKGFAVVAEEVRNLAMRSAEAAKNTADMIEGSVKNAENGVNINQEVLKNLEEINGHAKRVSEVMAEIAAASDQQSQGVGQVNTAMEQMNQLTQQNAANSEESASASEELSAQAQEMRAMVAGFRISGGSHSAPSSKGQAVRPPASKSGPAITSAKKKGGGEEAFPLETSSNGHDALKDF